MRERERRTGGRRKRTSRSRHLKALPIRNQWMLQILNLSEKQTIFFGRPDNRFKGPHCFKKQPKMKPLPMSKTQMTPSPTELHYRTCRELSLSCSAFPPLERVPHRPVLPRAPVPGHRGRVESLCGNCLAGPSAEDSAKRAGGSRAVLGFPCYVLVILGSVGGGAFAKRNYRLLGDWMAWQDPWFQTPVLR